MNNPEIHFGLMVGEGFARLYMCCRDIHESIIKNTYGKVFGGYTDIDWSRSLMITNSISISRLNYFNYYNFI